MRISKRVKEDKGAANTVSFIVIILFVMALLVSFIDVGVYFNVKNEVRSAAENGARNVALYGGTEGSLRPARGGVSSAVDVVYQSISTNFAPSNTTTKVVEVQEVTCGPTTSNAGDSVNCTVSYKYNGLAGRFGMFQLGKDNVVKVVGTAVSEVKTN